MAFVVDAPMARAGLGSGGFFGLFRMSSIALAVYPFRAHCETVSMAWVADALMTHAGTSLLTNAPTTRAEEVI
jgi:hypothetical protein